MLNFEVFDRTIKRGPTDEPHVTIRKRGILGLNPAAYTALGSPLAVEYLFDPERRVMGIRPATHPDSYTVKKAGNSYQCHARAFITYCQIGVPDQGRRYTAHMEENILCVDLSQTAKVVTSNRTKCR